MLKLRLKRVGRKGLPAYRLVVMNSLTRRDGRPIAELGYYDPISKKYQFQTEEIKQWLLYGAKPTETVSVLLRKSKIISV